MHSGTDLPSTETPSTESLSTENAGSETVSTETETETATPAATTPRRTLLQRLRNPRAVWFVPVLAVIALLAWVFASPIGSAPDDDFHMVSIWCANPSNGACLPGSDSEKRIVPGAILDAPCFAFDQNKSAACQKSNTFIAKPTVESERGNFDNEYPPVFYAVMSIFAGPDIVLSDLIMRIFTVLLFLGLTIALYVLLPVGRRSTLVLSWAITTIPLGIFLLASDNPSSWAIIGVGSAWQALLGYFETEGKRRIALGAIFAVSVIMAAGSRSDAAFYSVIAIGAVIWLTFTPRRRYFLLAILPVVMAVVAVVFFATSGQTSAGIHGLGVTSGSSSAPSGAESTDPAQNLSGVALLAYNLLNVQSLWAGVFGQWGLGWLDTPLPAVVTFGATAVFAVVAFTGLSRLTWRKLVVALGLTLLLWLVPVYVLGASDNAVGTNVQPRYILPLIVLLGGVILLTQRGQRLPLGRVQTILIIATLSVVNFVALHIDMQRYISGNNHASLDLDAHESWWWSMPISPDMVWLAGSLAYAIMLIIIVREVTRRRASALLP